MVQDSRDDRNNFISAPNMKRETINFLIASYVYFN